jgi:hypothetical protein
MATSILLNQTGGKAVLKFDATTTISLANLATSNTENVQSFVVSRLRWTTANNITIARGSNTIATLYGTDQWDLGRSSGLAEFPAATLVVTINTGGTIIVDVEKAS